MADKVTVKRSTRVSFIGVSNLPQAKAISLRDQLQTIIQHLSDLHASVDDPKIKVDDRSKQIRSLSLLQSPLDLLLSLVHDQLELCNKEGAAEIRQQLNGIYEGIREDVRKAKEIFQGTVGEKEAALLVDILLAVVKATVEMLQAADRYTIQRAEEMARETETLATRVADAKDTSALLEAGGPLARSSVETARLASQRAAALDPSLPSHLQLERASGTLAAHTPALIGSVRNSIKGTISPADTQSHLQAIRDATGDIIDAMRTSPEFAVLFDVDYIDTELGLKLAALAAAVKGADPVGVAGGTRAVNGEVEKLTKPRKEDPKSKKVQEAAADVAKTSKEALAARLANESPGNPGYVAAENKMHEAMNNLRMAASALPNAPAPQKVTSSIHLLKAAKDLSSQLQRLLV